MAQHATPTEEPNTIPQLLNASVKAWPEAIAIEDGDCVLTYTALQAKVEKAARALISVGIEHGDRVAIWAPNCWEWVVAGLAIHSVGAAIIPLNTRYKGEEARFILEKSGATALFTVEGFLGNSYVSMLRQAAGGAGDTRPVEDLENLQTIVVLRGDDAVDGAWDWDEFLQESRHVPPAEARQRADAVKGDDLSDILFTSGTTGAPKGVMTEHAQNLRVFQSWSEVVGLRAGDRYLIINPFFHSFGYKAGWLACLIRGATILPQPIFDVSETCRRIEEDRITVLPGPPAIYQSLLRHPERKLRDFSTLRVAITGAASIPVKLIEDMFSELKLETVLTAYGLTETCGVATMCRQGDSPELIATTSGRAIPGVELRIVDQDLQPVPAGESGQIAVRGYNVMRGYFNEPDKTEETIVDGWLLTGDVGHVDDEGNIAITDRIKDMFINGGFNVYPAEVEDALLRHEAIAEVAVVGMPDTRLGEVGCAFIVLHDGATATEEELYAWSRERMANYKVPRRYIVREALPRNATGKVTKFTLREWVENNLTHAP